MKSHEKDVKEAEGLPMGMHRGGKPEKVMDVKHNSKLVKQALANHERRVSGGATSEGDGPNEYAPYGVGQTMPTKENPAVQKKAHGFNERSQAGNADPTGGWGK